jgi:DNA-binding NtrC family response regulator
LRERLEDLGLLVESFLAMFVKKYNKEEMTVSEAAMKVLQGYSWPGNVRELRNVIERAVVLSRGVTIEPADFPDKVRVPPTGATPPMGDGQILTLEEMVRLYIRKVVEYTGGNKLQAARLLDIDPKTLRTKLHAD